MTRYSREAVPARREHREDVRAALRAARLIPQPKGCFVNAAKLVAFQSVTPLVYVEGYSFFNGNPFPHAWVRTLDGVDHDVTLRRAPGDRELDARLVLTPQETAIRMRGGFFGPWFKDPEEERAMREWSARVSARVGDESTTGSAS